MGKAFTPELHLEGEFLKFFRKLRRDINTQTGASNFFSEIEGDIGEMLYTAQKDGKTVKDVIGDSEEEYLEELIKTFYEGNPKEKIRSVKIGTVLTIVGMFGYVGIILSNSIMLSIGMSMIGLLISGIIINKINGESYSQAIKYNKILNYSMYAMVVPFFISGIYIGNSGRMERLTSPFCIGSIVICIIGAILVKWGNLNSEKQ